MQLDIHHLQVIRAIADAGSLSKAAVTLGITQPAVSSQLMRLESMLGYQLFDRGDGAVVPTPMGELLLRRVGAVLPLMNRLVEDVRLRMDNRSLQTAFRLGAVAGPLVAGVCRTIRECWPEHVTALRNDEDVAKLVNMALDQKLDVVMTKDYPNYTMTMPDEMDFHLITDDEPSVIVMRSDHRLACEPPDRPIQLADLAEDAWVLPRRTSSQGHEYVTETCHEHGFEPKIRHSVENWPMALMLIRDGAIAWSQAGTTLLFRDDPDYTWRWLADGVLVCRHWIGWHRESFVSDHGARLIASVHADHESFRANWPNRPTPGRDPINSTWQTNEEPTPEWLS